MKKSQDNMGNYERYKMYKSGKNWTYSAIAVGMIATGIGFTTTNVHADTIKANKLVVQSKLNNKVQFHYKLKIMPRVKKITQQVRRTKV